LIWTLINADSGQLLRERARVYFFHPLRMLKDAEALAKFQEMEARCGTDYERLHGEADDLLVELLKEQYPTAIAAYENMTKWYA
jgi:hypothetical protein